MDINIGTCLQWSNIVPLKLSVLPKGHQVFWWGVLVPLLKILFLFRRINKSRLLISRPGSALDIHDVVVSDMHEAHFKHSSLILISFQ